MHFLCGNIQMRFTKLCGDFARLLYGAVHNLFNVTSRIHRCPQNRMSNARPQHRELHALMPCMMRGDHRFGFDFFFLLYGKVRFHFCFTNRYRVKYLPNLPLHRRTCGLLLNKSQSHSSQGSR